MNACCVGQVGADLEIHIGTVFRVELHLLNPDRTPMDVTGAVFESHVRRRPDALLALDLGAYATVDEAEGRIQIEVPENVTSQLAAGAYIWDAKLDDQFLASGNVTVRAIVTHP
jgi:hypothetical protein